MENKLDFNFLVGFVSEAEPGEWENITCCNQLKALWTAYCIIESMDVDTARYDKELEQLWEAVISTMEIVGNRHMFADLVTFGGFMCEDLV